MTAIVEYKLATYSGELTVNCMPEDDNEIIIAKAKQTLQRRIGSFPFGYEHWRVLEVND